MTSPAAAAELRDALALERTRLANERTVLAYLRTALAFAGVGVAAMQLFDSVAWVVAGWAAIGLAVLLLLFGLRRYRRVHQELSALGMR
jgi:putative membrane protein